MEYFTLAFDMPFMLLLSDLRQGVFYATLLSFWLVFAGEHMLVSGFDSRRHRVAKQRNSDFRSKTMANEIR